MRKALLIAEKPDLMNKIEAVYDEHEGDIPYEIHFVAQRGHLLTQLYPDEIDEAQKVWSWENLPFFPEEHGGWKYKIIEEQRVGKFLTARDRYNKIKDEIDSQKYDFVINAGDPDQEGELLVRIVLEYAKNKLPIKRFWTNDLTESHILNALQNLRDDEHDPVLVNLYAAARGRSHADYYFGMNISRAGTLKMNTKVACGRVKTPIQAIVCRREEEIKNFIPKTVYGVRAQYKEGFEGNLFEKANVSTDEEEKDEDKKNGIFWFETKTEAESVIRGLSNVGTVTEYEEKEVKTYAPKLFKLATLQIEAGKLGYSDGNTLRIIQQLYEKKLLSYPRTDCEYLSSEEDFYHIILAIRDIPEFTPFIKTITKAAFDRVRKSKKWINDKALEESGHSAIRPTTEAADLSELADDEIEIYKLVCRRFIAMFLPPLVQMQTRLVTTISGKTFISTGKRLVDPGYTEIFGTKFTDKQIPKHVNGDNLDIDAFSVSEKTTQCPKRFTSPDLIAVCESPAKYLEDASLRTALGKKLKLGTPATRSQIIEQLITKDHYLQIEKEGKREVVIPTEVGTQIIHNLGPCDICKIDMTGEWELKLEDVRSGKLSLPEFEEGMRKAVVDMIADIQRTTMTPFEGKASTIKIVGKCPVCGMDIAESEKGFFCRGGKKDGSGCSIKLWKSKFGTTFSYEEAERLWKGEEIEKSVTISLNTWKQKLKYDAKSSDVVFVAGEEKELCSCPSCGGKILVDEHGFHCNACGLKGMRSVCGALLNDTELTTLFGGGKVTVTCRKEEKTWSQQLYYKADAKKIEFYSGEESEYTCPCCEKKKMNDGEKSFRCPGCGFSFWKVAGGHEFTKAEIDTFMSEKSTGMLVFVGPKGKYKANVKLDKRNKKTRFEYS